MNKVAFSLAAAGAMLTVAAMPNEEAQAGSKKEMEKCYGVVKAGKNDCGNAAGTHSCAGYAKTDGDGGEWVFVPKGLCDRLVGGSTAPKS